MARSLRAAALLVLSGILAAAGQGRAQQAPQVQQAPQTPPAQQAPPDGAAQPPERSQPPIFRTGVNFVRVDVIVTDKSGGPVSDLKPEDFIVTEAGKAQKIETFKLVSLDGGLMPVSDGPPIPIRSDADEQTEAARDDVRLFGMFLDDYHVKRDSSLAMRQQLARFVETQLGPSDMIGLMYPLQSLAAVRMTRNHDVVRRGILEFEGRKYDYRPRNQLEEQYVYRASAEQIERFRNQLSFRAIRALIMHMGSLKEGRKALILVSEGFSNTLPPQLQDAASGLGAGSLSPVDPHAGNSSMEQTRQFFASADIQSDLAAIYDLANRNNVAIYTVDPRGLATSEFAIDQPAVNARTDAQYLRTTTETLRVLSDNSDGRALVGRNDLTIAMKQIVVDSSAYYLLGYNSTLSAPDGKFHEITVKVKRPGVQVRHRRGYWALTPEDAAKLEAAATAAATAKPNRVEASLAATVVHHSRVIRTWIGTERGENGRTRVTFVWEPMPKLPGEPVRDGERAVRVALTALSPDGPQYFRGRVPDAAGTQAATASTGFRVAFDAQPGKMQLRLSVEGTGAEVIDSETREIVVPDLTSPQTSFGTPEVFRARTLPEFQRLKSDPQPVPAVAREFSRTERLMLRVPVYGPAGSTPALTAHLVNRTGQVMSELPVAAPDATRRATQIELPLANLSPGEYAIALTATGDGGDAKELVAFRVVP